MSWTLIYRGITVTLFSRIAMSEENLHLNEKEGYLGFPFAIFCDNAFSSNHLDKPDANDTVRCTIGDGSTVFFNSTITWGNSSTEGYFFDLSEKWRNVTVTVSAFWNGVEDSNTFVIRVTNPSPGNCVDKNRSSSTVRSTVGESEYLGCYVPEALQENLALEQFNSIRAVWYKECDEVEKGNRYNFRERRFSERGRKFETLEIKNADFQQTPGTYQCVLKYKKAVMEVSRTGICVRSEEPRHIPEILADSEEYSAAPGEELKVGCSGFGEKNDYVIWEKTSGSTTDVVCDDWVNSEQCTYEPVYTEFCHPASKEELRRENKKIVGKFHSTYTIKSLTHEHSGVYNCILASKGVSAAFTITIQERDQNLTVITVIVITGLVVLAVIAITIVKCRRKQLRELVKTREISEEFSS